VDFSAAEALRETFELLEQQRIRLVRVEVQDTVFAELE
jgi:hypothetical protein